MFIPNIRCQIRRRVGTDMYGKASYGPAKAGMCGIVRLEQDSDNTSVRADSSASRGTSKEENTHARLLFPARIELRQGDIVSVVGMELVVQSIWPRHSISGHLDHWQVDLQAKVL